MGERMIRTSIDRRTGVNYNLRNDFGVRMSDAYVDSLVRIGRRKQQAMWKAMSDEPGRRHMGHEASTTKAEVQGKAR